MSDDEKDLAADTIRRLSNRAVVGKEVAIGEPDTSIGEGGQQRGYVVLSKEEREKGFVRPVRLSYIHLACGGKTNMGVAIAETYARNPHFYGGTFCVVCRDHFPVGENGEFVWDGTDEKVGT